MHLVIVPKLLWDKIKTTHKLSKSNIVLTRAGSSKLAFLGFTNVTCSIGKFNFTEEFAVINGMVSDMPLGIRWEHKFNIHTGWTRSGTFKPVDEEVNEVCTTTWDKLDSQMFQAHAQLRKKRSYRRAREKVKAKSVTSFVGN